MPTKAAAKSVKKDPGASAEKMRKKLLVKREELLVDLQKNREVSDESVEESAQDMADRATSSYMREFAYSLSEADRKILVLIEEALTRLDTGTYGTCVNCAQTVQEKRLEAVPWARHCIDCQELQDKGLL